MEAIDERQMRYNDALLAAVQNFVGMAMADALVTLGRQRLAFVRSEMESYTQPAPPPQTNTLENKKEDMSTPHQDELSFRPWIALLVVQRVGRGGLAREQSRKSCSSLRLLSHNNREERALQSGSPMFDGGSESAACVVASSSSTEITRKVDGGETEEGREQVVSSTFSISAPEHVFDEERGGVTRRSVGVETTRKVREEAKSSIKVAPKASVSECAVQTSPIMRPAAGAVASSYMYMTTSSSYLVHAAQENDTRIRLPLLTATNERHVHVQGQSKSKSGDAHNSLQSPLPASKGLLLLDACGVHLAGPPQSPKRLLGHVRQARAVSKSSTNSWTFPDSPYRVPVVGGSQIPHKSPQKRKERANLTSAAAGSPNTRTSSSRSLHFSAKSALALRHGGGGNGTPLKKSAELNKAQTGPQAGEALDHHILEKIQHYCRLEADGRDFLYRLQRSENDKLYYSSAREKLRIESDAANVAFEAYFRDRRTQGIQSSPLRKRL